MYKKDRQVLTGLLLKRSVELELQAKTTYLNMPSNNIYVVLHVTPA